jgi:aminoglycoside phosphotransferase (APT) family kinase protein
MSFEMNLRDRLENYLSERQNKTHLILKFESLSGGACQDNYLVDVHVADLFYPTIQNLVLRTDKGASLFASISKTEEFQITQIAVEHGVLTPRPVFLEENPKFLGNSFYLMERIEGKATGRYIVKDPSLSEIRKKLSSILALELSKIHNIKPPDLTNEKLKTKLLGSINFNHKNVAEAAIKDLRIQKQKLREPHPAMDLILNWLEKHIPETDEIVLVHGDFRTGNFMITPQGLTGIMDWEFAHFGDRHEDIAWLCMRDWRFGKQKLEAGGFAKREEFYREYQQFSNNFDPEKVHYWEIMGNLRWAIGSAEQAERHISGTDKGIELASIGRRTCEMEWEAMRLIENAR